MEGGRGLREGGGVRSIAIASARGCVVSGEGGVESVGLVSCQRAFIPLFCYFIR